MLRLFALTALVLCVLPAWSQDAKKEIAKLEGTWKLVGGEAKGEAISKEEVESATMTVKEGAYEFASKSEREKGKFLLNPATSPAQLDIDITEGESKGKKQVGIYELKGDRLKFCVAPPGETTRPTKFGTSPQDTFMIYEFEKVQK